MSEQLAFTDVFEDRPGGAREFGHDTEHQAGARAGNGSGTARLRVLEHLAGAGSWGRTDYEISVAVGMLRTSAGKRRKELAVQGFVAQTGERRPTDTGAPAIVWRITPKGLAALDGMRTGA